MTQASSVPPGPLTMALSDSSPTQLALYAVLLALPLVAIAARTLSGPKTVTPAQAPAQDEEPKTIMQPARDDLDPPKDTPYTLAELSQYDGADASRPIYVAIKGASSPVRPLPVVYPSSHSHAGTIFDVTRKADVYGAGKGYNVFAGKDGSKGLGMSSLKPEHAVSDYSTLEPKDRKTLDDWYDFFAYVP
jgi:membrane-associated progesterone receptor component